MNQRATRILLADDHPFVRKGIRAELEGNEDLTVVGEAGDGEETRRLALELEPDVLLLDLQMPGPSATETVEYLRHLCPRLKVLVLSAYDDDVYVQGMLAIGVAGYVLKDDVPDALVRALRAVRHGDTWFSGRVLQGLAGGRASETTRPPARLTRRELAIVRLLATGMTDREIGLELDCGERTVRYLLTGIYRKLQVDNRTEAAVRATQLDLVGREGA